MKEASEETKQKIKRGMREWWANLSTEQKALIAMRQSVAMRRRWASLTKAERKERGRKISEGRKKAKSE